jgi:hypothetical protein
MRRSSYLKLLLAVPVLAALLTVVPGCPDKKAADGGKEDKKTAGDGKDGPGPKKDKLEALVGKSYDGVIKGKVTYDGTPPVMKEIAAVDQHADKATCHGGSTKDPLWIVGKDGAVADVIVYLEAPKGKFLATEEKLAKEYKDDPWIDQPHCLYEPQTVALFAAYKTPDGKDHATGLKLMVRNTSTLSHNTKIVGDGRNNPDTFDENIKSENKVGVPAGFKYQKEPLSIGCTKHTWMTGTLKTFDHPFFAVTSKDGTYEFKNVPVGVEVAIKTWHKDAAEVSKTETFKAGDNSVDFKVKSKS